MNNFLKRYNPNIPTNTGNKIFDDLIKNTWANINDCISYSINRSNGIDSLILIKDTIIGNEIRRSYLKISIVNGNIYQANFLIKPYNVISERNHEICRLYFSEGITQEELASIFGMSQSNISKIIRSSKLS